MLNSTPHERSDVRERRRAANRRAIIACSARFPGEADTDIERMHARCLRLLRE